MACTLKAIVAVCNDWGIGKDGDMVVSSKVDMRHFRTSTTGHAIVMGRKTLDSFPGGRPLKNRRNIVLTRDTTFEREGVEVVHSLDEALAALNAEEAPEGEAMAWVIGGGEIYRQFMPYTNEAVVTKLHADRSCDTFFPNLDEDPEWELKETVPALQDGEEVLGEDGCPQTFCTYVRK